MAIPEKPESRAEMYLNKIASGSGTIPAQPESRLEQYLDAIARNGGGGGSGGGSGGGGVLMCHLDFQTLAIDHTWQEIYDAGFSVLLVPGAPVAGAPYTVALMGYIIGAEAENEYGVNFYAASAAQGGGYELVKYDVYTDSPNGYPVLNVG